MYGIDILEEAGPLTEHDYEFLKGNDKYWAHTGAALNIVHEWCQNNGLGSFGDPTPKGKRVMREFEERRKVER